MNVAAIVKDRLANAADLGQPVEAGDVAEVICKTSRGDTCVIYEVHVSLRSLAAVSGTPEERIAWYVTNWSPRIIAAALVSFEDAFRTRPSKHFTKKRREARP